MVTIEVSKTDLFSVRSIFSTESNLLDLKIKKYERRLGGYEKKYGMDTHVFIKRFEDGELGDDEAWFHWSADFETLELLKIKTRTVLSKMRPMLR